MKHIKKLLAIALTFAASIYAAERVYLAPISAVGINENIGIAAEKLMNAYIDENNRYVLISYSEEDSIKVGDRESINKKAKEKNCTKFIMAEFTRLGENVITSFKLYNVNSEVPVWSDRLKANNPEDIDPIVQRVARNIGTSQKATRDNDIYTVTQQETKTPKKKGINTYGGVKVIGTLPLNPDPMLDAGLGIFLFCDAKDYFFNAEASIVNIGEASDRPTLANIMLSLMYPFGTSSTSPFIGGGLAFGYREGVIKDNINDVKAETSGLSLEAGGGVVFNRASRVMAIAQVNYFVDFFTTPFFEAKKDTKDNSAGIKKNHYMNGFKFSLGLALGV